MNHNGDPLSKQEAIEVFWRRAATKLRRTRSENSDLSLTKSTSAPAEQGRRTGQTAAGNYLELTIAATAFRKQSAANFRREISQTLLIMRMT